MKATVCVCLCLGEKENGLVRVLSRIWMSRLCEMLQGDGVKPCVKNPNLHHKGSDCTFKPNDLKRGESMLLSVSSLFSKMHSLPTETLNAAASECWTLAYSKFITGCSNFPIPETMASVFISNLLTWACFNLQQCWVSVKTPHTLRLLVFFLVFLSLDWVRTAQRPRRCLCDGNSVRLCLLL